MSQIDVLIDGVYIASQNNNRGLRGSTNQRIHFLSERLVGADYDFEGRARQAEIHVTSNAALLVGVPPHGVSQAFRSAIVETQQRFFSKNSHDLPVNQGDL